MAQIDLVFNLMTNRVDIVLSLFSESVLTCFACLLIAFCYGVHCISVIEHTQILWNGSRTRCYPKTYMCKRTACRCVSDAIFAAEPSKIDYGRERMIACKTRTTVLERIRTRYSVLSICFQEKIGMHPKYSRRIAWMGFAFVVTYLVTILPWTVAVLYRLVGPEGTT